MTTFTKFAASAALIAFAGSATAGGFAPAVTEPRGTAPVVTPATGVAGATIGTYVIPAIAAAAIIAVVAGSRDGGSDTGTGTGPPLLRNDG